MPSSSSELDDAACPNNVGCAAAIARLRRGCSPSHADVTVGASNIALCMYATARVPFTRSIPQERARIFARRARAPHA